MSRIIKPKEPILIQNPGDEVKSFIRERMTPPKSVKFNEIFEHYLTMHLQRFPHFEENLTRDNIEQIRDFIWKTLRNLFSKSSSNDKVTDRGIDFISNVYMKHIKINNVVGMIIPLEAPEKIANTLSDQELRFYSDIFKMTEVGDICDNVLMSR